MKVWKQCKELCQFEKSFGGSSATMRGRVLMRREFTVRFCNYLHSLTPNSILQHVYRQNSHFLLVRRKCSRFCRTNKTFLTFHHHVRESKKEEQKSRNLSVRSSNPEILFGTYDVGITNRRKNAAWDSVTTAVNYVGLEERSPAEFIKKNGLVFNSRSKMPGWTGVGCALGCLWFFLSLVPSA